MITDLRAHAEPYVTATELAAYWGIGKKQVYKQIAAGTLRAIRLGPRILRIKREDALRLEREARLVPVPLGRTA